MTRRHLIIAALASASIAAAGCATQTTPTTTATAPVTQVQDAAPQYDAATEPTATTGQQQAVQSAQNYLDLGIGISKRGLLDQLTSSYGADFTQADATYAINHIGANWNLQAVESAQNYLDLGIGMSRQDLLDQLTSSYGAGFTQAQAQYAVNKTYR